MACGAWAGDISKTEHKNWVEVGRGMLITKNGIKNVIQRVMEAWHQTLVTNPSLLTCQPCTCGHGVVRACLCQPCVCRRHGLNCVRCKCKPRRRPGVGVSCGSCVCCLAAAARKCTYCATWKGELEKLNPSANRKDIWTNCIWEEWWCNPWEVAKVFMPPLGTRSEEVKDATTTDLGGLMNLLEWCPFMVHSPNRKAVADVREKVRNLWAHSANHELSNDEKTAAIDYMKALLTDPVFAGDKDAQDAVRELDKLLKDGLVIVRETEQNALIELRNELLLDLEEAQIEKKNLNEEVQHAQQNIKDVGGACENLEIKQRQNASRIAKLKEELQYLNHKISNFNIRVQQVENKVDLLADQWQHDKASQENFVHYARCNPDFADVFASKLRDEILNGKVDAVKKSIEKKEINLEARDREGQTLLHWAVRCGELEICRTLLEHGCETDSRDNEGSTPLHEAAKCNQSEIAYILVSEYGADIDAQDDEYKFSALHWAAQEGHTVVVSTLVSLQCNLEIQDKKGNTSIHQAAANGRNEVAGTLIACGANRMALEQDNFTPLHYAACSGHTETVELLLDNGCNTETQDRWERTPLILAAKGGHDKTLNLLIDKGKANIAATDNEGYTALHWAAHEGFIDATKVLLANGSDTDSRDKKGNSPLHRAAQNGKIETISVLIDSGTDIEALGENNFSPFHLAVNEGQVGAVKQLLEKYGANVESKNIHGNTPLHTATSNGNSEIVRLLLSSNANVAAVTDEGRTALHLAAMKGEQDHVMTAVELLQHSSNKECRNKDGDTPLLTAARNEKVDMVELLVSAEADVNAAGISNYTALHWSAQFGNTETAELLLDFVTDVDRRDKWNYTPLHRAARNGHQKVAKILIAKGADVNARNEDNVTPLTLAETYGHQEMKELIKENGGKSAAKIALQNAVEDVKQAWTEAVKKYF